MSFPWQLAEISVAACLPLACMRCHQKALLSLPSLHILYSSLLDKTILRRKKDSEGGQGVGESQRKREGRDRKKSKQQLPLSSSALILQAPIKLLKGAHRVLGRRKPAFTNTFMERGNPIDCLLLLWYCSRYFNCVNSSKVDSTLIWWSLFFF